MIGRSARAAVCATGAAWAFPASADDWAAPIVGAQNSLADLGINVGGSVTGFGQGLAAGEGVYGAVFGGKADVLLGLDGGKLLQWPGFSVSAHLEQDFGRSNRAMVRSSPSIRRSRSPRSAARPRTCRCRSRSGSATPSRSRSASSTCWTPPRRRRRWVAAERRPSGIPRSPRRSAA